MKLKNKIDAFLHTRKGALGICLLIVILILICVSSIECQLEPEFVAKVRLDPQYFPSGDIYEAWHTVYEAYEDHPGTWIHHHEYYQKRSIDEWPEMDLENYTYIITYCQRIESLSYNVLWGEDNVPIYTGITEGHMVLSQTVEPLTIFIYRIPKMRINNPEILG